MVLRAMNVRRISRWSRRSLLVPALLGATLGCSAGPVSPVNPDPKPSATTSVAEVQPSTSSSATPVPTTSASTSPEALPPANDVDRSNTMAVRFLKQATQGKSANTTMSPTSIRLALGLVALGAKGETRKQLDTALSLGSSPSTDASAELAEWKQRGSEGPTLRIATRLFPDKRLPLEPTFTSTAKDAYGSTVESMEFAKSPEQATDVINGWVKKETEGRIPELFPKGTINRDTSLVVTNAVYFLGDWKAPFDKKLTKEAPFFVSEKDSKKVSLMAATRHYGYMADDEVQVAALPYKGNMQMLVVLPKERMGLDKVVASLDASKVRRWMGSAETHRELALKLPKWELAQGGSIVQLLKALGIEAAFTSAADLTGLSSARLQITDVVHKTFIRVDEKGTEAAAATGVVGIITSVPPPPVDFVVDHPFLYFIADSKTGRVLFLGTVVDPTNKG
jgi:serpin B